MSLSVAVGLTGVLYDINDLPHSDVDMDGLAATSDSRRVCTLPSDPAAAAYRVDAVRNACAVDQSLVQARRINSATLDGRSQGRVQAFDKLCPQSAKGSLSS